ncbi:MAG: amino acid permease [Planctomycetes bacterium]|nr:amino acid permease [Planctomycetota bacterium]
MNGKQDTNGDSVGYGKLGLFDTVCIIVGIVIGTSIFTTPPTIFDNTASAWEGLGVWFFCGVLSLVGALCYAELATAYPRSGGDYVYLTRAFDRPIGFLFGWAQLAVVLSGSTGAMAFIFGEYCAVLMNVPEADRSEYATNAAIGAVGGLTLLNFFGVVLGKWIQNGLVILKLVGLLLIVVAGLLSFKSDAMEVGTHVRGGGGLGVAIILVLYAYGGWNDAAFVAADMKRRSDIPKALILGTLGITVLYLLVNYAYIVGLGWTEATHFRPTIAADILAYFGNTGATFITLIVMISALGAMNGLIFTGSRVYMSLGKEHRLFSLLGRWNATLKAPIWSLLVQAIFTIGMIYLVGTAKGRDWMDEQLSRVSIPAIPWNRYFGGFNTLFAGTAPVFWIFFLLTGFAFFTLRARDPHIERPFKLKKPWYPILPLIFCGMCVFGLFSALNYAGWISLLGFVPLALGIPLYLLSGDRANPAASESTGVSQNASDEDS